MSGTKREIVYCNVQKRCKLSPNVDNPEIIFAENSGVHNIKKAIAQLQEEQGTMNKEIEREMEKKEEEWNGSYMKFLFDRQKNISNDIKRYTDGLVGIYEKEMAKLVERNQGNRLSATLKVDISNEIEAFKKLLSLGLTTATEVQIDGSLFSNLSSKLNEQCPLLFEIVECLLLISSDESVQTGRRVHSASHALAILCSLSSQKITSQ